MDIFEFENYRIYLKKRLESLPKKGHGQARKLALYLRVSTTLVSQVLSAQKHLTSEQAFLASEFFGLNPLETKYFLKLIQLERAGNRGLQNLITSELTEIKNQALKISNRLQHQQVLSDEQKGIFYSDWYYSAVRMLTSIDGMNSIDQITDYLGLPRKLIGEVVQFLLNAKLIREEKGQLKIGALSTHLSADSPWIKLHHSNWRNKALEFIKYPDQQKLHYSSPMTLSKSDVDKIRLKIVKLIEEVGQIVDPSNPEELMCLNIDWFKVHSKG